LNYRLPRLSGHGVEMSRLGGGIGTRGPGETQLETDRRRIARRIKKIADALEGVRAGRALHRQRRSAVPLATLALAGYTNAGKSTLFNRLTQAGVAVDARMFATLDPTVRPLTLPSRRRVLVSDTVGFMSQSAHHPGNGISRHPRGGDGGGAGAARGGRLLARRRRAHTHVLKVLAEIGAAEIPQILIMNKMDRLPSEAGGHVSARGVAISALTGAGIDRLLAAIDEALPLDPIVRATFRFSAGDGASMALLHEFGQVLETRYDGEFCELEAEIPESLPAPARGAPVRIHSLCGKDCGKGADRIAKVSWHRHLERLEPSRSRCSQVTVRKMI